MATRTVSTRALVGVRSLAFIRAQRIAWSVKDTKPSTVLYPFFDGVAIGQYITPTGGSLGGTITTDVAGNASGVFDLPGQVFNTGKRTLRLQDNEEFDINTIPGSTVGSASADFSAAGILNTFQETITNTTIVELLVPPPAPVTDWWSSNDRGGNDGGGPGDPLAQTFFTYGVKGGCYITKIDLYFQSKDANLPVTCTIRNVANGYPAITPLSRFSSVTKIPSEVNLSDNASAVTTFTFLKPIYLEENRDYCFVITSNSNSYNMWTSVLGDKSIETGKVIFEQPHVGTLFKSENNITWTAYQTEDIKFTLYRAKFDITDREVKFKANAPDALVYGSAMTVTSGSPIVTVVLPFMHGHRTGDKVAWTGVTGATYRGIPSATISNPSGFIVTKIDDYSFTFNAGANATSTGTLSGAGIINACIVYDGGVNYTAPTVAITGGGGTGATAVLVVEGGVIVACNITNAGSGYTDSESIVATVTDSIASPGAGAVVVAISEAIFGTSINRTYQSAAPMLFTWQPPGTGIVNTLRTSDEGFIVGDHKLQQLNIHDSVNKEAVFVNDLVEGESFGSASSTEMITRLSSNNTNVSPMIDLSETPRIQARNYVVNPLTEVADENTPLNGTSYSRYVSKIITLETPSKGIRVTVSAASVESTWFDVWVRTSNTGDTTPHAERNWTILTCETDRNLSSTMRNYVDYEFLLDDIPLFDVYDIKIVLSATYKNEYPIINNYRSIILAT